MASIEKILQDGNRSPDSSDNGFDSFGSGSASSPERSHAECDHFPSPQLSGDNNMSSDSGRVSSPDENAHENECCSKKNNFRPWETESKSNESRVPELGLHHATNLAFGLQNSFRLPFLTPAGFPQFNPFTPAHLTSQQLTIQQFLQQSNMAQNYVNQQQQKAYAALRIKSEFESLHTSPSVLDVKPHVHRHQDCAMGGRPCYESHCDDQDSKNLKSTPRLKKKENGNKPYKCPICEAQFNRPANLKTHLRIHSGEKPYKCDTCGARFVQVAHLRAHVLIHTGEKPYPCHICGTRFRHLQTLKSHIRIHTGEKPFSCDECSLRFRHKSQLRLHLRTKHGINTNTKKQYTFVPGLDSANMSKIIKDNSKLEDKRIEVTL